jgi:hypothetical protein
MDHLKSALLLIAGIAILVLCVAFPPLLGLLILGAIILLSFWSFPDRRARQKKHPIPDQLLPTTPRQTVPQAICPARQWRTYDAVYSDLKTLRQEIVDSGCPAIAGERGLLREEMLKEFAHVRPSTRGEWLGYVNYQLRDHTDHRQLPIYLNQVLDVINRGFPPGQRKGPIVIR